MTTKREDLVIVKISLKDRFDTAMYISRACCEQIRKPIFRKTVSRRLNTEKLVPRIPSCKIWFQRKIKRFVLTPLQSISCGQRNNGIWFPLEMNLNSTCLDLMISGISSMIYENCEICKGSVMVWGMISSAWDGPIVRFHINTNASVYKELLRQHALPHLRKGTVETPIFMKDHAPCHKGKTVLSVLEEEGIAVMKPWYESYRECMKNHRERSE